MQLNLVFQRTSTQIVLTVSLFVIIITTIIYFTVKYTYREILEYQAVNVAEIVATQAMISRSVYSKLAVEKLKQDGTGGHIYSTEKQGYIPLPAQFLKQLGKQSNKIERDLYRLLPLSKWNLEPSQGLKDEFEKWAWEKLEQQDKPDPQKPIDWQPIWAFEENNGEVVLRYLKADPASGKNCVSCHNQYEKSPEIIERRRLNNQTVGKQWKQHQLLGALEVQIPMSRVKVLAETQTRTASLTIMGTIFSLLLLISWFLYRNVTCFRNMGKMSKIIIKDPLTGALNRRGFDLRLKEFVFSAKNHDLYHALMYIDLDKFKQINDQYGHITGDKVLKVITNIMQSKIRDADAVSRMGGDEFAILLDSCSIEQAKKIAQSIMDELSKTDIDINGETIDVTLSIGLSIIDRTTVKHNRFIEKADEALYKAKEAGRNRICT